MKPIVLFFCLMLSLNLFSQENKFNEYIFLDKFIEADFNRTGIDSIISNNYEVNGLPMLNTVFNVVNGKYNVYRFLDCRKNVPFPDYLGSSDHYYIIILKTNERGKIIDGHWYHLTNAEMPYFCALYRISRHPKLISGLEIKHLRFKRVMIRIGGEDICECCYPKYLDEYWDSSLGGNW